MIFDGAEDVVDRNLEWCEVGLLFASLRGVSWGLFIDCVGSSISILLGRQNMASAPPLYPPFGIAID